jgi:hypothetical protein
VAHTIHRTVEVIAVKSADFQKAILVILQLTPVYIFNSFRPKYSMGPTIQKLLTKYFPDFGIFWILVSPAKKLLHDDLATKNFY